MSRYPRVLCANVTECLKLVKEGKKGTRAMNAALDQFVKVRQHFFEIILMF